MKNFIIAALLVVLAVPTFAGTARIVNTGKDAQPVVFKINSETAGLVPVFNASVAGDVTFLQDVTITGTCTGCTSTGVLNPFTDFLVVSPTLATSPVLKLKSALGNAQNMLTITTSTDTVLASVTSAGLVTATGGVQLTDGGAPPSCGIGTRGTIWHTYGAPGVADEVEVCAKDAANSYAWRTIY